jgi:hypothetical protein
VSTLTSEQHKSYDDRLNRYGGEAEYRGFIKTQKSLIDIDRRDMTQKAADVTGG